jgi:hypothetical protein
MSDTWDAYMESAPAPETSTPDVDPTPSAPDASVGQVEVEGTPTPEPNRLDLEAVGDHLIPVKIDGKVEWVTAAEAAAGYSRHSDYTRKTQAVAAREQQLANAEAIWQQLQNDPQGTVAQLQAWAQQQQVEQVSDEDYDPREARIRELEVQQEMIMLERKLGALQSKYPDFDPETVVAAAHQRRTRDLEGVYKQLKFDEQWARQQAVTIHGQQSAAADAAITAQKAQASNVVTGGATSLGGGKVLVQAPTTTEDAIRMAMRGEVVDTPLDW